jgi:hypothetical protein
MLLISSFVKVKGDFGELIPDYCRLITDFYEPGKDRDLDKNRKAIRPYPCWRVGSIKTRIETRRLKSAATVCGYGLRLPVKVLSN